MPAFFRIAPHFQIEFVEGEGTFLFSEHTTKVLPGALFRAIVMQLDGTKTIDEIVDVLASDYASEHVYYAFSLLQSAGYLVPMVGATFSKSDVAFWSALGVSDPCGAWRKLQATSATVVRVGDVPTDNVVAALSEVGIELNDSGVIIVVTDHYLREGIREINRRAIAENRDMLLVKPVGVEPWIGPLIRVPETGCWDCLASRLRLNQVVESYVQGRVASAEPILTSRSQFPCTVAIAANIAALELAKWLLKYETVTLGAVLTFDARSMSLRTHKLVRRPQCSSCGTAIPSGPNPIELQARKKLFTKDVSHRSIAPAETLKLYEHHVSPITGVVKTLEPYGSAPNITPLYAAGHNFALRLENVSSLSKCLRHRSAGKGKDEMSARAGALCEAIERHSAIYQGNEYFIEARLSDLGDRAIQPNSCLLFSENQYSDREKWNSKGSRFNMVPKRLDPDLCVKWSPVWSLKNKQCRYLPTAFLYFHSSALADPGGMASFYCDSNGNASGNTLEEAIVHGLLEVVERDSVALWWYSRAQRPGVDLASFSDPYFDQLIEYYESLGRELWVLDVTNDTQIPSFAAVSRKTNYPTEDIIFGFGSHLNAHVGVSRALTEMNQILPRTTPPESSNSEIGLQVEDEVEQWFRTASVLNQKYLSPNTGMAPRRASDYAQIASDDFHQDIRYIVDALGRLDLEAFAIDQTRPDIGLSTVKVIVPGMRHFWARFAPGRLYEIPMKLGWVPSRLSEENLNPIPMFL